MEYKVWSELKRKMAVEIFVMNATDMMIPADMARENALAIMARSDAAKSPDEQHNPKVQNWRSIEYSAGQALIALEKLGFALSPTPEAAQE